MMDQTGPTLLDNQVGLGFDHVVVETALGSRTHKNKNEDSYWPRPNAILLQPHATIDYLIMGRLYIVADGVSGGLAGDEASELAVQTIAEQYYATLFQITSPLTEHDIQHALKNAILRASNVLIERSHERMREEHLQEEERVLQSAVLCVLVRGKQATVANVGDCHLYRYRSGEVDLLSVADHSTAYFLGSPLQHHQIGLYQVTLAAQDVLILCSDGLYRYLSPDNETHNAPRAMRQIFQRDYHSTTIKEIASRLLEQANEPVYGGGRDNITVMLVEYAASDHSDDSFSKKQGTEPSLDALIKEVWWRDDVTAPVFTRLAQHVQHIAQEKQAAEQALWQRRAAQLGGTIGQPEWAKAQALSYQLSFDFEENYSLVQQIWHLHNQAPSHAQLAKLAFEAVVDLANTALLSADENKERMLSCALSLLLPLRDTLFKQIAPDDANYGEEVLLQLQQDLSRTTHEVLPSTVLKRTKQRSQRVLWLIISSLLFLLCLWLFLL